MSIASFKKKLVAISPRAVEGRALEKQSKAVKTLQDKKASIANYIDLQILMINGDDLPEGKKAPNKWFKETSDGQYLYTVRFGLEAIDWLDIGGPDYGPLPKVDVIATWGVFKEEFLNGTTFDDKVQELWDQQIEDAQNRKKKMTVKLGTVKDL